MLQLALTAAFTSLALPATAETNGFPAFKSGNWTGLANFYEKDDLFSHCTMDATYKSGISLFFSIDHDMKWRIGFVSTDWDLAVGSVYDVAYAIDNFKPNFAKARAASKNLVVVELPANSAAFQQFRVGRRLTLVQGSSDLRFDLDGTSVALSNLLACASEGRSQTASAYRPAETARAPQAASAAIPAEEKIEATRIVANILSSGELRDYKIMSGSEINDPSMPQPVKSAAVAWKSPSSIGLLHVLPASGSNVDMLVGNVIGGDAEACKGTYASGKIPDPELPNSRRVFTSCSNANAESNHIEYIFVPRQNGMIYRFTTVTFSEGNLPAPVGSGLRDAIKKAAFDE